MTVPTIMLNSWFHDDGTEIGTKKELQTVVDLLVNEGPARGLHLSTALTSPHPKSEVWSPLPDFAQEEDPLQRGIPKVQALGVTLLGAPIGYNSFVREALKAKVEQIRSVTALLPSLKKPHIEFCLLRSCLALPKILFSLRTVDTSNCQDILQDFDSVICEALIRILGVQPALASGSATYRTSRPQAQGS